MIWDSARVLSHLLRTKENRILAFLLISTNLVSAMAAPILIPAKKYTQYNVLPNAVSFDGTNFHQVLNDDGSGGYSAPQWKDNSSPPNGTATDTGDFRFPISYTGGTSVALSAQFYIKPTPPAGTDLRIQATGPGFNMPPQAASLATAGQLGYPESTATTALPKGTSRINSLVLNWQVSADGGSTWKNVGQTGNRTYITLADPLAKANLFQTVLYLATANGNATTPDSAVANTWAFFKGPANVTTWDGRPLYYYRQGYGFDTVCATSSLLLLTSPISSGQCTSFAYLMADSLGANGVASSIVKIRPTVDIEFLVKDWTFPSTGTYASDGTGYPYQLKLNLEATSPFTIYGMNPLNPGGKYGDLTSLNTLAGQNTAPPAEKAFGSHFIVSQGSTYYDPSYGVTYSNEADFQAKAVDGYASQLLNDTGGQLHVRKPGATTDISFAVFDSYK